MDTICIFLDAKNYYIRTVKIMYQHRNSKTMTLMSILLVFYEEFSSLNFTKRI